MAKRFSLRRRLGSRMRQVQQKLLDIGSGYSSTKRRRNPLQYFILHGYAKPKTFNQMVQSSPNYTLTRLLPSLTAARQWAQDEVNTHGGVGYLYKDTRKIGMLRAKNPGPSALPSKWTPATVTRKGGQIQIRIGGRK